MASSFQTPARVQPATYQTALGKLTSIGWIVLSEGPSGAQLEQKKKMRRSDKAALVLGFVTLLFYGLGVIFILAAVLDYAFLTKAPTHFLSRDNPMLPPGISL